MEYGKFKVNGSVIATLFICLTFYIMFAPLINGLLAWIIW